MKKLSQLAINDEGFIFDPLTGDSFQVSETGLFIIKGLCDERSDEDIAASLNAEFEVSLEDAQRDVTDFTGQLKNIGLG